MVGFIEQAEQAKLAQDTPGIIKSKTPRQLSQQLVHKGTMSAMTRHGKIMYIKKLDIRIKICSLHIQIKC